MSTAGTNPASISLDDQLQRHQMGPNNQIQDFANPLWLNVTQSNLGPSDTVHAVWMQGVESNNGQVQMNGPATQADLTYAGNGRFTVQLPKTLVEDANLDRSNAFPVQQLELAIDGQWQTNPASGQPTFNVRLDTPGMIGEEP
jgi:hypothetical protein